MDNIVYNFAKISFAPKSSSNCKKFNRGFDRFLAKTDKMKLCATKVAAAGAIDNMIDARRSSIYRSDSDGLISNHLGGVIEEGNQFRFVQFNSRNLNDNFKNNNMAKKGRKTHTKRLELKKTTKNDIEDRLNKSFDGAIFSEEEQQLYANDNSKTTQDDILL